MIKKKNTIPADAPLSHKSAKTEVAAGMHMLIQKTRSKESYSAKGSNVPKPPC